MEMKLWEREKIFWRKNDYFFKYMFPVRGIDIYEFTGPLEGDGAKLITLPIRNPEKRSIINSIKIAKESKKYVGIGISEISGIRPSEQTFYVLNNGLSQALLTNVYLPHYIHLDHQQEHAVLEFREGYKLSEILLERAMENMIKIPPLITPLTV